MRNRDLANKIILELDNLNEFYIPSKITARDSQIRELKSCMEPAIRRNNPIHALLCGFSGSGKTMIAKHVLNTIQDHSIDGIYINCWEYSTLYSIMNKIVEELKILRAERSNTAYKIEKFEKFLDNEPFIIVLDEVDKTMPRERNLILYNLCDLNKVGLICICASQDFLFSLDERVRSRLNPRIIEFQKYSPSELYEILKDRAKSALRDNSWNQKILQRIVSMANGDARIAIQTLRHAANIAENQRISRIKIRHLEKGSLDAKDFKINKILSSLTVHHSLIYSLIKARKEILSRRLWEGYQLQCKKIQIKPVPSRTFAYYRNQLINTGLISSRRAGIRGNVRIYSINKNSLQMRIRSYC